MRNTVLIAILSTSLGLALSGLAPVSAKPLSGAAPADATTQYVFCYGGHPSVAYFSQVFPVTQAASPNALGKAYSQYLTATYGTGATDTGMCVLAQAEADGSAEKQRREASYPGWKIIESDWTAPADLSQPAGPPRPKHH